MRRAMSIRQEQADALVRGLSDSLRYHETCIISLKKMVKYE